MKGSYEAELSYNLFFACPFFYFQLSFGLEKKNSAWEWRQIAWEWCQTPWEWCQI